MRRVLLLGLLWAGCNYDAMGLGTTTGHSPNAGDDPTSTTTTATTTTTTTSSEGTTTTPDGSSSSGTAAATTLDPDTTTGPPLPTASSCAEILALDPTAPTGIHEILRPSDGVVTEVHCEMDLDGGGWTLVARSNIDDGGLDFGWGRAQGTLGDGTAPYSLDAIDVGLSFTQILITRRTGFALPATTGYVVDVPLGFLEDYRTTPYQHAGARTVLGSCEPMSGPTMLRWIGYTQDTDRFFTRDYMENDPWGLFSDGFHTAYGGCAQGGDLDGRQGAIFVR